MPRRASKVTTIDGDCHLESEQVLAIMCDLQLYSRLPVLAAFRSKMIRWQGRARQLREQRVRDVSLRKLYHDIVEEFKDRLWELYETHRLPGGFVAFMRERHGIVAERFVCSAQGGQVVLT